MLKHLFLLFNAVSLIIITALLPADIKVEMSIPEMVKVDSTYIVDITIHKGQVFGFAKFQQELPEGYDVQVVESSDASFTYAGGKVKFIWMALPEQQRIKISYALIPREGAPASGIISGKFSYIEDNERKSYDLPNANIALRDAEAEEIKVPAEAVVERIVNKTGDNEYLVELRVRKQGIEGFAKIEEYVPNTATAVVQDNKLAVFSQVDEKAKFVWMSVPAEKEFSVTYKVSSAEDIEEDLNSMEGSFSFLDEDETKMVPIGPAVSSSAGSAVAAADANTATEETSVEPEEIAATTEEEITEQPISVATEEPQVKQIEEPVVEPTQNAVAQQTQPAPQVRQPVSTAPAPETGIKYKVQIVAGHKLVTPQQISAAYNFQDAYQTENHEGWIKYIVGGYANYKAARDKRVSLVDAGHNFPGPFVTAYNEGSRITVQEALMITNQKWFQ